MDSKELLKSSELSSIREFFRRNRKYLEDVVAIGSSVKGKMTPADLDIVLVLKSESMKLRLIDEFPTKGHISAVSLGGLFKEPLWRAVIQEGFSLVRNGYVARRLGFTPRVLLDFNTRGFEHKVRVRFNYALRGRNGSKGMLGETGAEEKANCVIVPTPKELEFEAFLDSWGVRYKPIRMLAW